MANAIAEAQGLGHSIWYDNIRRAFIESGDLARLIGLGVSGLTSNPTIFEKAISAGSEYDHSLMDLAISGRDAGEIFEELAIDDIRAAADLLRPVYDRTDGADGYASFEVSPHLAHDTQSTVKEARRLFSVLDRQNVMVKVPATPDGMPAIRCLIGEGINVNVTLIFALESYRLAREAYIGGLEDLDRAGGDLSAVASVASFFVSRVDAAVDYQIWGLIRDGEKDLKSLLGKAAVANAKLAYRDFKVTFAEGRFLSLMEKGARVQRPLWASTSTKNPEYSDLLYVESLIGRDTVNTMPDGTLNAFLEHGRARMTLEHDLDDADLTMERLEGAGIDISGVTSKLLVDGVAAFAESFDKVVENVDKKAATFITSASRRVPLGQLAPAGLMVDLDTPEGPMQQPRPGYAPPPSVGFARRTFPPNRRP